MSTWTEIASLDIPTSGAFDFPSVTMTGYVVVQLVCAGITVTTDDSILILQYYVSGSLVTAATYKWGALQVLITPAVDADGLTTATGIIPHPNETNQGIGNAAGEGIDVLFQIDEPLSTALYKKCRFEGAMTTPAGAIAASNGIANMDDAGAIEGFKLTGTSDLTAGKVRILGMA